MADTENKQTVVPDLTGEVYTDFLARLHRYLKPRTYFEIGTRHGDSLKLADCYSIAIDPGFALRGDVIGIKPTCIFYQTTSDEFFSQQAVTAFGSKKVDFSFLDGMHLFEFLLRDIINIEKFSHRNSIIAIHDCVPVDVFITSRVENDINYISRGSHRGWWTGDVWKVIPILKEFRPDLVIHTFNAAPTGLVILTNLNSSCDAIEKNYFEILNKWKSVELETYGIQDFYESLNIQSTSEIKTFEDAGKYFWL